MAYAAWTKGTAALLLAARALAHAEGVEETLLAEWALSQPQLAAQSERAAQSGVAKGWRWIAEMEEIAHCMADAGPAGWIPPGGGRDLPPLPAPAFGSGRRRRPKQGPGRDHALAPLEAGALRCGQAVGSSRGASVMSVPQPADMSDLAFRTRWRRFRHIMVLVVTVLPIIGAFLLWGPIGLGNGPLGVRWDGTVGWLDPGEKPAALVLPLFNSGGSPAVVDSVELVGGTRYATPRLRHISRS